MSSAILLGLGIWTLADRSFMNELLGTNLFSGTVYVLIGTAAFVCIISFFGCYGAAKEVKSLLLFVSATFSELVDKQKTTTTIFKFCDLFSVSFHSISCSHS